MTAAAYAPLCKIQKSIRKVDLLTFESLPRRDAESLSKDEMRALLRDPRFGDGWVGDAPEKEWALFISGVVKNKLRKLAGNGFRLFDQNWLVMYDNIPLPNVHLARAIGLLKPLLADFWASVPAFDTLFIERDAVIAKVTASASEHFAIRDLWMRQE